MPDPAPKRVAVMQPYFFPYAGYFRLFAGADEFVLFDCVQFPRRGRVHRTEVPAPDGGTEWLTLPLARQPRDVRICDLEFAPGARAELDARLRRHAWIPAAQGAGADRVRAHLFGELTSVVDFLERGLQLVLDLLGLTTPIVRSSSLRLDDALKGADRVIAAARARGADEYLNAPGGRALYDGRSFARAGLALIFLAPYAGPFMRLLPALMTQDLAAIRRDVLQTSPQLSNSSRNAGSAETSMR